MPQELADSRSRVATAVAVATIAVLIVVIGYLLYRAPMASETEWTRSLYLLGGLEAMAFAAAGFFFGREVYRMRLLHAERRIRRLRRIRRQPQITQIHADH